MPGRKKSNKNNKSNSNKNQNPGKENGNANTNANGNREEESHRSKKAGGGGVAAAAAPSGPPSGDCDAVIVGGGLAGCLLAAELASRPGTGRTRLYELRDDPRDEGKRKGGSRLRSINLALSTRGLTALDRIAPEAAARLREVGVPMRGRAIHSRSGDVVLQPYGRTGQALLSVSRAGLNAMLLDAAERAGADVRFGMRCVDVDTEKRTLSFEEACPSPSSDAETHSVRAGMIIGADGASSRVRGALQSKKGFNFSQHYISHGYKELSIPAGPNGEFLMEKEALHIWPRDDYMLIALPNAGGSFTLTLFMAFSGADASFESLQTDAQVTAFFAREFPDAVPLMPTLLEDFRSNPVSSLVTVRCEPWSCDGVAILGDAAHAIVPFFGQGCNCAFEDVRILSEMLDDEEQTGGAGDSDYPRMLREFSLARKRNADAIADLALYNYEEMRSKTNSMLFVARRSLEQYLEVILPSSWQVSDLHSLVSFTNIPYSDVVAKVKKQDRVIDLLLAGGLLASAAAAVGAFSLLRGTAR